MASTPFGPPPPARPTPSPPESHESSHGPLRPAQPPRSCADPLRRAWGNEAHQAHWEAYRDRAVRRAAASLCSGEINTLRALYDSLAKARSDIAKLMGTPDAEEFGVPRSAPWTTVISPYNRYSGFYEFLKSRMRTDGLTPRPVPRHVNAVAAIRGLTGQTVSQVFGDAVTVSFWSLPAFGFECLCIRHPDERHIPRIISGLEPAFCAARVRGAKADEVYDATDQIQRGLGIAMPSSRGSAAIAEMVVVALEQAAAVPVRRFDGPATRDLLAIFSNNLEDFQAASVCTSRPPP